ncbi:transposase domain-containing protein [Mangrovibacter phragmitis]|uniref:transposase domain-containing protein n=1 Tax=Mangrovibacter phragmitis TaxID=1691903 RepID=UPI00336AE376
MEWVSANEVAGIAGLPTTPRRTRDTLERMVAGRTELRRKREGSKAFEYHISALPPQVRAEFLTSKGLIETGVGLITLPENNKKTVASAESFERQKLWQHWEKASNEQRLRAEHRAKAVALVAELQDSGLTLRLAMATAAKKLQMSEGSLRNLYYRVQNRSRDLWAPVLLDRRLREKRKTNREAPISEDAWQFFLGDYLRPEEPCFTKSYELLVIAAREYGWEIPSERTLRRRVEREVDVRVIVATRKGDNALARMFPSQQRTVAQLSAMEWINGDGYQHNVFVRWYNGEVIRPKTWVWQDVHSRKIIGWRTDVSENSDSIRLSLMDAISDFGKPEHVTIDNTRAAANKWLSGGVPNRYRFKVKPDDPMGILPLLGIQVHWTSVIGGKGWGQAKPVERSFGIGGLGDYIDKHPSLAGAYTGPNTQNKPDNYGDRVVDVETFLAAVNEGIAMYNAKTGRNTEMCRGEYSFDQAFENSYRNAIVTRLSDEQIRQLMLPAEAVTVKPTGEFLLESGGTLFGRKNSYWNPALANLRKRKITVRFDPRNLHSEVACYDLDGRFLCMAECRSAVAFGDTETGREHSRQRKQMMSHTKRAARAQRRMTAIEVNDLLPDVAPPEPPQRHVVERVFSEGNALKKVQEVQEQQNENDVIFQALMKSVSKGKK